MVKEGDAQVPQIVNTQDTRSMGRSSRAQCAEVHALTVYKFGSSVYTIAVISSPEHVCAGWYDGRSLVSHL